MAKMIPLDEDVEYVLETLNFHGKGYIVGGAIRDILLKQEPKDIDFCTNIEYDKLLEIFSKHNPRETSKHFKTITITVNNKSFDISNMRKDVKCNSRKDTEIEFVDDIVEDLKRRDFTINAMAYDGIQIKTINQLSINDLKNKIIRFVGNADTRIKEDPLRIIRGLRFSSQKGFMIESNTIKAIEDNRELLTTVSSERIASEIDKILKADYVNGMKYLYKTKCLNVIFNTLFIECAIEKITNIMYSTQDINVRYALLYRIIDDEEKFYSIIRNTRILSNCKLLNLSLKIAEDSDTLNPTIVSLKEIANVLKTRELYNSFLEFCSVYKPYWNVDFDIFSDPVFLNDLKITGTELSKIIEKKTDIGRLLKLLLKHVHLVPSDNTKDKLLNLARELK